MASSVEKVAQLGHELAGREPETPQDAQMMALFQMVGPAIAGFLPTDPDELDDLLAVGARWALSLRSDEASPVLVHDFPELDE